MTTVHLEIVKKIKATYKNAHIIFLNIIAIVKRAPIFWVRPGPLNPQDRPCFEHASVS